MKNYRPIALTSILGKLIESVITDELVRQLEEGGIINLSQHGFRSGTGCHTALISMWSGVTNYVESHEGCSIVGLDMTKAFDLADHQVLIDEMSECKIEYKLGEVVKSWLENKTQFVQIGDEKSNKKPINGSVVQGSRLGPVLWLIYINGLLNKLQAMGQKFSAFADNVIIYGLVNSRDGERKIQESLYVIQKWSGDNYMKFSDAKSNYMNPELDTTLTSSGYQTWKSD